MNRIKRSAAFLLIGILALSILTGCYSTPVPPPVIPSVPSTPTEPETPEDTKTPEEIGQLFVERVKTTVKEVSQNLAEGDSLFYATSYENKAKGTLNVIKDDGTIDGKTFGDDVNRDFFQIFTETDNPSTAKKLTMENMNDFVTYIQNLVAEREKGYPVVAIGVYYRVIGNDVYAAVYAHVDAYRNS